MNDCTEIGKDPRHVARERQRARVLRQTPWWRARIAAGRCHYCGAAVASADLTMDHLVPVARGGRSTRGNVVAACRACNATKRCQTPAEQVLAELEREQPS